MKKAPAGKDPPPLPGELAHVWQWFVDLCAARPVIQGIVPLGYAEIEAYSRLMDVAMLPREVDLIRDLDRIVLAAAEKKRPKRDSKGREFKDHGDGVDGLATVLAGLGERRVVRTQQPQTKERKGG